MPIDREVALKAAERLLRQGKLDGAIEQYVRLIEEQPRDWTSINALGDLYVRAGDTERAVAQYVRIADFLFGEGFLPKAAALYKKALKVRQDHEHTLFRLAEIAAQQGLLADAKLYLRQLSQQRKNRGDERGVAECILRLAALDEDDGDAKVAAAQTAQALGDVAQAVTLLLDAAAAFEKQNRGAEALDAKVAAATIAPDDTRLRSEVARALITAGQVERAQPFISADSVGDDVDLLLAIGRNALIEGRNAEAHATLMRVVAMAPDRQDAVASLANEMLAAGRIEDGYACVEILVDAALFEAAFDRATQQLEAFLERHSLIPALLKLVDVYVDAGLDDRVTAVQARLVDAYLEAGQAAEARIIAEDLIVREPQFDTHAERVRRALDMLGVDNPDEVIARLRDRAPLFEDGFDVTAEDFVFDAPDPTPALAVEPAEPAAPIAPAVPVPPPAPVEPPPAAVIPPAAVTPPAPVMPPAPVAPPADDEFAVDLDFSVTLTPPKPPTPPAARASDPAPPPAPAAPARPSQNTLEVDLSTALDALDGISRNKPNTGATGETADVRAATADPVKEAAAQFEKAQEHLRNGMSAEAAAALQAAARVPQWRFKASAQLGRLSVSRGDMRGAVEWLERAAEAPSPSADETHAVLYDLADALESVGEFVRALALFVEVEAEAGAYRDVGARIEGLNAKAAAASAKGSRR